MDLKLHSQNFDLLSDRLRSDDLESKYRQYNLNADINQATVFIALALFPVALAISSTIFKFLIYNDAPDNMTINLLINSAALILILSFIIFVNGSRSPRALDRVLFLYMTLLGIALFLGQYNRPPDYVGSIYLLYFLNNALLMPVALRVQVLPTISFGTAIIALILLVREPAYFSESINVIITIISLTAIGFASSRMIGRYRRMGYLHLMREQSTRSAIQDTVLKVKKLSGLIPICAYCLSIRDEDGEWLQTEGFLKDHSMAEFSHGHCPDCAEHWTSS